MDKYFLRLDIDGTEWQEVSLAQFIDAEYKAGFRGGNLERGCTATASFSGNGVCGLVERGTWSATSPTTRLADSSTGQ